MIQCSVGGGEGASRDDPDRNPPPITASPPVGVRVIAGPRAHQTSTHTLSSASVPGRTLYATLLVLWLSAAGSSSTCSAGSPTPPIPRAAPRARRRAAQTAAATATTVPAMITHAATGGLPAVSLRAAGDATVPVKIRQSPFVFLGEGQDAIVTHLPAPRPLNMYW